MEPQRRQRLRYLRPHLSPTEISATGARVDDSITNLQCELRYASSDELPEWLEEQPVQRFLKLTPESETASEE